MIYLWITVDARFHGKTPHNKVTEVDPAMGGQGGATQTDQMLVMAARSSLHIRHEGKLSLKSLTFGPFLHEKWTKGFQLQWGFVPVSTRGSAPEPQWELCSRPHYRLTLHAHHSLLSLSNPGSTPAK